MAKRKRKASTRARVDGWRKPAPAPSRFKTIADVLAVYPQLTEDHASLVLAGTWTEDQIPPLVPHKSRSEIVASMRADRMRRASFAGPLVPPHVHEIYAQIWRGNQEALLREEAIRAAYTWRGIRRRIFRRIADFFAGHFQPRVG